MAAMKKKPAGFGVFRSPTEQEKSQYIGFLVDQWERQAKEMGKVEGSQPFVTVSRQAGCMGFDVGLKLAQRLNERQPSGTVWMVYDREIVHEIADKLKITERLVDVLTEGAYGRITDYVEALCKGIPSVDAVFQEGTRIVRGLCEKGHAIIIGRGGCMIGAEGDKGFHLRLVAPLEWRVRQTAMAHNLSLEEAEQRVALLDGEREDLFRKFFGRKPSDPERYDLILNQARFAPDQLVDLLVQAMAARGLLPA